MHASERATRMLHWLSSCIPATSSGRVNRANPRVALRMLAENPELAADDPWLACAIGDEGALRQATEADPSWVNRPGGPLQSAAALRRRAFGLLRVAEFRTRLHRSAQLLLAAGADANQRIGSRWPPGSLSEPDSAIRCRRSTARPEATTMPH